MSVPEPHWLGEWPTVAPRSDGRWAVGDGHRWGLLDPESGTVELADPRADRKLPGLAPAIEGGDLIAYRPERRAVVAAPDRQRYVKVVRPAAADRVVDAHALARGASGFTSPDVVAVEPDGRVELTAVAGPRLHDVVRARASAAVAAVTVAELAELLAALRSVPGAHDLPTATFDSPQRWITIVGRIEPVLVGRLTAVAARLPEAWVP